MTKETPRTLKTILALVLVGASLFSVATSLPAPGLLRVPRIYNALITSDEKLQPSRASPYSAPAFPVVGAPGFARIDGLPQQQSGPQQYSAHHHEGGHKENKKGDHAPDARNPTVIPAVGKKGETIMPKPKSYPLTFYPRSVGYYPQAQPLYPFLPYSYPYGGQPFAYGGYPGVGFDGAASYSQIAGAGSGVGGGFGPYSPYSYDQHVQPAEFTAQQSSSVHVSRGKKGMVVNIVPESGDGDDSETYEDED